MDRVARSVYRSGDALVVFDSAAREVRNPTLDSIVATSPTASSGECPRRWSRQSEPANELQRVRDSVEILVVSPFGSDALDAATASIRRVWPGTVRTMRAGAPRSDTTRSRTPDVRARSDDAVSAALALHGAAPVGAVRVVRDSTTARDTAWARQGGAVVVWPRGPAQDEGWQARVVPDTAFGVTVNSLRLRLVRVASAFGNGGRSIRSPRGAAARAGRGALGRRAAGGDRDPVRRGVYAFGGYHRSAHRRSRPDSGFSPLCNAAGWTMQGRPRLGRGARQRCVDGVVHGRRARRRTNGFRGGHSAVGFVDREVVAGRRPDGSRGGTTRATRRSECDRLTA